MKTTGCGMNFKVIIIILVLPYQPKKKDLSVFGGNDTYGIWENVKKAHAPAYSQVAGWIVSLLTLTDKPRNALKRLQSRWNMHRGITEQLKAENAMEWVQKMNNIRHRAEEIICSEIIYA